MSWNCPHCGKLMKPGWTKDHYLCFHKCEECSSFWLIYTANGFDRAVLTEIPKSYYEDG